MHHPCKFHGGQTLVTPPYVDAKRLHELCGEASTSPMVALMGSLLQASDLHTHAVWREVRATRLSRSREGVNSVDGVYSRAPALRLR